MLSELKETNKRLREKLQDLKLESGKYRGNQRNMLDSTIGHPKASSSRRGYSRADGCCAPASSSGRSGLLSDRAKHIRGEATKRIDNLLYDWKDFKLRADDELRKHFRSEQSLKEHLTRKDRELSDMSRELSSLKLTTKDQKKMIDHLHQELDAEEKCRNRCVELESQIGKLNRHIVELNDELDAESKCRTRCAELEQQIGKLNRHLSELNEEIRIRDELLRSTEMEKDSLSGMNSELRQRNHDQKKKIEMCEHDVNETRMELEILEEMVRALNDRKLNIFSSAKAQHELDATPLIDRPVTNHEYPMTSHSMASHPTTSHPMTSHPMTSHPMTSQMRSSRPRTPVNFYVPDEVAQATMNDDDRGRAIAERLSAMSTLKSMQKEQTEKVFDLAERIQQLKDENKMKDTTISELKKSAKM